MPRDPLSIGTDVTSLLMAVMGVGPHRAIADARRRCGDRIVHLGARVQAPSLYSFLAKSVFGRDRAGVELRR